MNAVGSGVNLVRTMEAVASSLEKEPWSVKDNFNAEVAEIIDTNLAYSLMDELRNYASHGQLIVSVYLEADGSLRAAFDVEQLRNPIFIETKRRVKEQLLSVSLALNRIDTGPIYLSYCLSMDSFAEAVASLYLRWLEL